MADDKDIVASRLRLGEQAALMLNIDTFLTGTAKLDNVPRNQKTYNNFAIHRTSGGHVNITKALYRNDSIKYLSTELPGAILSILQPSIKIYKVLMPTEESKGIQWRIPFDDTNFKFASSDSGYKTSAIVESTLDELINGTGRMHGVGIKSFTYKYEGTNPAEVNTNISADLSIYFQDVRDLVREISVTDTDPNFEGKSGAAFKFSYADLVADSVRRKDDIWNTEYFRIKIVVGYVVPNKEYIEQIGNYQDKEISKILEAIKSAKVIFYLNPHNHDISFEENGSVTVNIKYIASIASTLASLDVLSIAKEKTIKDLKTHKQNSEDAAKKREKKKEEIDASTESDEVKKKKKEEIDNEAKVDGNQNALENARNLMYSEVFRQLIGVEPGSVGKIYSGVVDGNAIGLNDDGETAENSLEQRLKNLSKARGHFQNYSISKSPVELALASTPETKGIVKTGGTLGIGGQPDPNAANAAKNTVATQAAENTRTEAISVGGNNYLVKFVFLGDLLDIFCQVIEKEKSPIDRPRLMLTSFDIELPKIPVAKHQSGGDKIEDKIEYERVSVNLSDIPITLDMLHNFFIEKIVKPRRDSYPLLALMHDILSDVVGPAVGPSVFGKKSVLNKKIRMSTTTICVPFDGNNDIFTSKPISEKFGGIISDLENKLLNRTAVTDMDPFGNYAIFYCSNQFPELLKDNNGQREKDEKDGVYHFCIGSDTGIIKKLTFKKTDTPFYKEAKAQSSGGNQSLARLREVYDVDISMFGNNIYRPGDYIFIDPLFFRGNVAVELQNKLGLGGYYQVIDVATKFNENIYDTSITAVLYAHIVDGKTVTSDGGKT